MVITISYILDHVAPLKSRRPKAKTQPWLNEATRAARQECRKAERKWKTNRIQIHYNTLRESLIKYQDTVEIERVKYFSDLITKNCNNPRVLFDTINTVLNPSTTDTTPHHL